FFNKDLGTRFSKLPVDKHLPELFPRFALTQADDHTFACRQSIRLEHDRRLACCDVVHRFFEVRFKKGPGARSRDAMAEHELLGEILAPLEACAAATRTQQRDFSQRGILFKVIANAGDKGPFRTNDDQANVVIPAALPNAFEVVGRYGDVRGDGCGSRVARRNKDLVAEGTLLYLPGQRVFAAAITNNQNIHIVSQVITGTPKYEQTESRQKTSSVTLRDDAQR